MVMKVDGGGGCCGGSGGGSGNGGGGGGNGGGGGGMHSTVNAHVEVRNKIFEFNHPDLRLRPKIFKPWRRCPRTCDGVGGRYVGS